MKSDSSKLIGLAILIGSAATGSSTVLVTHAGGLINEVHTMPGTVVSTAVVRNTSSSDTLYFRYTVDPSYNSGGADFGGFELHDSTIVAPASTLTVGVGNSWYNDTYEMYSTTTGYTLKSNTPTIPSTTYQKVLSSDLTTIAFSIAFNPSGLDTLTVWMNPDFTAEIGSQTANRTTTFTGNFKFDTISLRELGGTGGWNFSNIKVATSPTEIGFVPEPSAALLGGLGMLALLRRRRGA